MTAQSAVGRPTTGMHPMTNPRTSVSASRRGVMPWRKYTAAFRFMFKRICIDCLTFNCTEIDARRIQRNVKLLYLGFGALTIGMEVPMWHSYERVHLRGAALQ